MRVIKNINNNVAICIDSKGKELIAFAKGIGFKKPPYDIELSQIDKTFYDIDTNLYESVNDIEMIYFSISDKIVDYGTNILDKSLNSSIVFTLADHIKFAIIKYKEKLNIHLPILNDIEHLYTKEYSIGEYAIKLIEKECGILLPKEEKAGIALHFINAEKLKDRKQFNRSEGVIRMMTQTIEQELNVEVDLDSFNYSRFVSHIEYLLKRTENKTEISSENSKMYETLVEVYPKVSYCVNIINDNLDKEFGFKLGEEELLYLILHINRLYTRGL